MNPPGRFIQHLAVVALILGAGIYTFYKRPGSKSEPVKAPAGEEQKPHPTCPSIPGSDAVLLGMLLRAVTVFGPILILMLDHIKLLCESAEHASRQLLRPRISCENWTEKTSHEKSSRGGGFRADAVYDVLFAQEVGKHEFSR